MNGNYYGGGYPQGGYAPAAAEAKAPRQKKEKINSVELTGHVESRARNQEIRFFEFPNNGGGAIHINVRTQEFTGTSDQNGNPKMKTAYIPVSVKTNKNITAEQLKTVVPGMKVHVVGRLTNQQYDDRNGQKRSSLVVEAYVFEILEMPMMQTPYGPQPYGMPPQQQPMQQYPPQYGQPVPAQQPYPQYGQPYPQQYGQPAQPAQQPFTPPYPQPQGQQQGAYYNTRGRQPAPPAEDPNDLPIGDVNI